MGITCPRLAEHIIMPDITPIRQPTGLQTRLIERAPTASDMSRWQRLKREFEKASNLIDAAGLLLENIYTTKMFADQNGINITIDPQFETRFFELKDQFEKLRGAIRMAEDHKIGIRPNGNDIDFVELPEYSMDGLIIPVIVGAVILAGAVAAAIYQQQENLKLVVKYGHLLNATDDLFCKDQSSPLCEKWEQTKKDAKYEQNMTIAQSLKKGIKTIAGGAATGLMLAIGLIVFLRSKK